MAVDDETVETGAGADPCLTFDDVQRDELSLLGHPPPDQLAALCLSGGGIRSAAFAMGVVTGLARDGVLDGFHYLSTVSGGGYTGSWLSAWIHRAKSRRAVIGSLRQASAVGKVPVGAKDLPRPKGAPAPGSAFGTAPEPMPVGHVRAYCSYLSPRWGLLSADAWTVLGTYVRNLIISAVVLVPLLAAVLLLPLVNAAFVGAVISCLATPQAGAIPCGRFAPAQVSALLYAASGILAVMAIAALRVQRENCRLLQAVTAEAEGGGGDNAAVDRGGAGLQSDPAASATDPCDDNPRVPWLNMRLLRLTNNGDVDIVGYFVLPFVGAGVLLIGRLVTLGAGTAGNGAYVDLALWGATVHFAGWLLGGLALRAAGQVRAHPVPRPSESSDGAPVRSGPQTSGPADPPRVVLAIPRKWSLPPWAKLPIEVSLVILSGAIGGMSCLFLARKWLEGPLPLPGLPPASTQALLGAPLLMLAGLVAATLLVAAASLVSTDDDREFWARSGSWFLVAIVALLVLQGIALYGPVVLLKARGLSIGTVLTTWGAISGALTAIAGLSPSAGQREQTVQTPGPWAKSLAALTGLAAPLFLLQVLLVIALTNNRVVAWWWGEDPPWLPLLASALGLIIGAIAVGYLIKLDEFSLHALYRNRLVRTFLGASRLDGPNRRRPDPFTGFDTDDDLLMRDLATPPEVGQPLRLLHIVNLALNIGRGGELAVQHRKAVPFTVSGLHAGSHGLNYRRTGPGPSLASTTGHKAIKFVTLASQAPAPDSNVPDLPLGAERAIKKIPVSTTDALPQGALKIDSMRKLVNIGQEGEYYGGGKGISLGTAMTISGAAASPNMGYHSSPIVTFLMTLLNVRLGRWLGNPGAAGTGTYKLPGPIVSSLPIIEEAFQLTGTDKPFVYLSDGGHFENLGLYEMVRRRCRWILVADASADPEYFGDDLARAVQLIRLDFGVRITFQDPAPPGGVGATDDRSSRASAPEPANASAREAWRFRVATIHYKDRDTNFVNGLLLVIKPAVFTDDPIDVRNQRNRSARFPHDQTVNQWFTEAQFEAYRMLGEQTVCGLKAGGNRVAEAAKAATMAGLEPTIEELEPTIEELAEWLVEWFDKACGTVVGDAEAGTTESPGEPPGK